MSTSTPLVARLLEARAGGRALSHGELTRIAVFITDCSCHAELDPATCAICAGPLPPPGTGRPRRYCGTPCRRLAEKQRRNR